MYHAVHLDTSINQQLLTSFKDVYAFILPGRMTVTVKLVSERQRIHIHRHTATQRRTHCNTMALEGGPEHEQQSSMNETIYFVREAIVRRSMGHGSEVNARDRVYDITEAVG